ncbi:MAG: leucyl aminopeptidase [Candidatus Magasanikbacteria bacterium]
MTQYNLVKKIETVEGIIVPVFSDKMDSGGLEENIYKKLIHLKEQKDFEGKSLELHYTLLENMRVFFVGLGEYKKCTLEDFRKAIGSAVMAMQGKKIKKGGIFFGEKTLQKFDVGVLGEKIVITCENAQYAFDEYREEDAKVVHFDEIQICADLKPSEKKLLQKGIEEGSKIASGVLFTRTLGNIPPSIITPEYLAKEAKKLEQKENGVKVKVLERTDMEKLGMGCLLGVSQGSDLPPKFIILEYLNGKKNEKPYVFVGKGITFDSGGLSLKPANSMKDMKFDMLGAATVLGIIKASAELHLKKNIIGLIPACENMPSGSSYRPDDILTAMNGKTVLIENTDAEGRLILADALCYAHRYTPKVVVDFATLTGACVVALGQERSGIFSPDEILVKNILECTNQSGEKLWHLPLGSEYTEALKCEIADITNVGGVGGPGYGGASTGAAFLEYFTVNNETKEPGYPWAHIDLASCYMGKGKSWIRAGANGFGVETFIQYLR